MQSKSEKTGCSYTMGARMNNSMTSEKSHMKEDFNFEIPPEAPVFEPTEEEFLDRSLYYHHHNHGKKKEKNLQSTVHFLFSVRNFFC